MAKKTSGQNPVDEAYLRSLMAGVPSEVVTEKPSPKTIRTALTDFIRKFLTSYKCEGRQGVYIDKELHQKISVIVGIAGKRQLTVGNYIDNVLKEHFEKHSEEVKTYLQKSYNKIF